ncbi:MAG: hypothetical protein ACPGXK_08280 [Phycisphaerae bacterium]
MAAVKEISTLQCALAFPLLAAVFLLWMILDVGIVGDVGDPADWLYLGMMGFGALGALLVKCQPRGMVGIMAGLAVLHFMIMLVVMAMGLPQTSETPLSVFVSGNLIFVFVWMSSALMFRQALTIPEAR